MAGLALAGLLVGLAARRVLVRYLTWASRLTPWRFDDIVFAALGGPIVMWGVLLGLYAAVEVVTPPAGLGRLARQVLLVLGILSVTWAAARTAGPLAERLVTAPGSPLRSATLITNLVRLCVITIGGLIALQSLGIAVTPILTALGVGGLAVALALQDTLANLFAGVHILASRQVRPGDFVKLSSGEEGFVQDVTWRYTTVRQLANNLTVVPNAAMAAAVVTNYARPEPELAVLVEVGVAYGSDLDHVERVTTAVGREVMREVEGAVPTFEPFIRYHTFGPSSIDFTVILRAREFVAQYLIKHEFIKRLQRRYRAEGIEIPFPIRTVRLERDGAQAFNAGRWSPASESGKR